jgi:hypothetical protein
MRKHIALAAAAAALGAGLVVAPSAQAAADGASPHAVPFSGPFLYWNANHHALNIRGASATGHEGPLDNGRVIVQGLLKDSDKDDHHAACLQIHAKYADGGTRDEWVYTSRARGTGIGPAGGYSFASSVRTIWVREGIGNGGRCTRMASGVYTIYPR